VSLVSTAVAVTQRRTPEANRSNEKLERSRHNDSEQVVKDRTIENMRQRGKSFRKSIFEILDESRGADEQKLSVLDENEEDDLEGSKDPHAEQDTVLATHPVSGITKADELVRRMTFVPPPPPPEPPLQTHPAPATTIVDERIRRVTFVPPPPPPEPPQTSERAVERSVAEWVAAQQPPPAPPTDLKVPPLPPPLPPGDEEVVSPPPPPPPLEPIAISA